MLPISGIEALSILKRGFYKERGIEGAETDDKEDDNEDKDDDDDNNDDKDDDDKEDDDVAPDDKDDDDGDDVDDEEDDDHEDADESAGLLSIIITRRRHRSIVPIILLSIGISCSPATAARIASWNRPKCSSIAARKRNPTLFFGSIVSNAWALAKQSPHRRARDRVTVRLRSTATSRGRNA
jgi:hypothetical protein